MISMGPVLSQICDSLESLTGDVSITQTAPKDTGLEDGFVPYWRWVFPCFHDSPWRPFENSQHGNLAKVLHRFGNLRKVSFEFSNELLGNRACLVLELRAVKPSIQPVLCQQLGVGALLHQSTAIHHQDQVSG
jgi:hypothetical protein